MARFMSVVGLALLCAAGTASAQSGNNGAKVSKNGFLLNLIAFDQCPSGDFLDSNRHQIAVQAGYAGVGTDKTLKVNKIFLKPGEEFWVQDGNACDDGANFYLPISGANCSNCGDPTLPEPTFTEYEVKARVVGKPNSSVKVTSCVEMTVVDPVTLEETLESFCSVGENNIWVGTRTVGSGKTQNRWENVSTELLTVCVDTDGDLVCDDRIGLFDPAGEDYWWNWETTGRPHVQLVFMPVQSGAL